MAISLSRAKAQGSLEYLLLIGGSVLVATVVLLIIFFGITQSDQSVQQILSNSQSSIALQASGGLGTPIPLAPGNLSIGSSPDSLALSYAGSPTYSLSLNQLISPTNAVSFSTASLWKAEFQNSTTKVKFSFDSASLGKPISILQGNPSQLIWDPFEVEPNTGKMAQIRLIVFQSGSDFQFRVHVDTPAGYDVTQLHFPEMDILPINAPTDDVFITGWQGGQGIFNPFANISVQSVSGSPGDNPLGMFALYDNVSRKGVYWSLNDGAGFVKRIRMVGVSSHLEWDASHEVPIPTPASYETPYSLVLSPLQGNWFDAAQKYRAWALTQPMVSRGKWEFSSLVSQKVKDAKALILLAEDPLTNSFASYQSEIDAAVQFFNSDHFLVHWYSWHVHPFDNDWPDNAEKSFFSPAVNAIHAAHPNISILPYYFAGSWDTQLGTPANTSFPVPPNSTNYPYSPSIASLACAKEDGTPLITGPGTAGWTFVSLDPSFPQSRAHESQVVQELISRDGADGVYLDAYSGATPPLCYNDPALTGHPKNGGNDWTQNKRLLVESVRDAARVQVPDFVITTENLDEHLIPAFDVMNTYPLYFSNSGLNGFTPIPLFSAIYHDYIPLMTINGLDPTGVNASASVNLTQRVVYANYFHFGFLPTMGNWQLPNLFLFDSSAPNYNPNIPLQLDFMQKLLDSESFTAPYQRYGQLLRPVSGTLMDTLQITPAALSEPSVSVWRSNAGKVGIILVNASTSASSLNALADLTQYGFSSTQSVSVTRTDGIAPPTLIGNATGTLDLSLVSVPPLGVVLLELQ